MNSSNQINNDKNGQSILPKQHFDPELAQLSIFLAEVDDNSDALIFYQNNKSLDKFGDFTSKTFKELFYEICLFDADKKYSELFEKKYISFPGRFNNIEVKFHARINENIIQTSVSDNTRIFEERDRLQREKIIDSFLMHGSHELKTPLNAIMGLSSMLLQNDFDEESSELLNLIFSSSQKLDGVINRMLEFIHLDLNSVSIDSEKINISSYFKNSFDLLDKYLYDKDFNFELLELESTKYVRLDKGIMDDIVNEIAINLRRNTPPGKKIEIRTYDTDFGVKLEIENAGMAIPPDELENVFKPFYLLGNKMHHSSGYEFGKSGIGMGLTIIKRSINKMGGKIWFQNKYPFVENKENCVILNIEFPSV